MNRPGHSRRVGFAFSSASLALLLAACAGDALPADTSRPDLAVIPDLAEIPPEPDLWSELNECGDREPGCTCIPLAPPFPLPSDPMTPAGVEAAGVKRDVDGKLVLSPVPAPPNVVWIANGSDWSKGTISKIDGKTLRETARYFTVTCYSNPEGSTAQCDGKNGCCARDDGSRFRNRLANMPEGARQQAATGFVSPSRTAVDADGNVMVVNRSGAIPSVTRIAYKKSDCSDRNKNGRIDTSQDSNNDGLIQTDCNGDGQPDDLASVKQKPCTNNLQQEFYGPDDECVLWTTNFDQANQTGRAAALDPSGNLWVSVFQNGQLYQIDAQTGRTRAQTTLLAGCFADGMAIDAQGIAWTVSGVGGQTATCYFDTRKPVTVGKVRVLGSNPFSTGIGIDRDGNVWHANYKQNGGAIRYAPDRSSFDKLGNGYWTEFVNLAVNAGARGQGSAIAVDARAAKGGFVWVALNPGGLAKIPLANYPPKGGADQTVDGSAFEFVPVAGNQSSGAAIDVDLNVWTASSFPSVVTRVKVDGGGKTTKPDIMSQPGGNNRCPAGDTCTLKDAVSEPNTAAYSAFTPYNPVFSGLPAGRYAYSFDGSAFCPAPSWRHLEWSADVPTSTTLAVRARPAPGMAMAEPWQGPFTDSPQDFTIDTIEGKLQVEFVLSTKDAAATPRIASARACFKCP
mgnify:CR=1 FL=1